MKSNTTAQTEFSTEQVAKLADVSLRQLQWWDEHRFIRPRRVGHRRIYGERDVFLCCLLGALRRRGMTLKAASRMIGKLRGCDEFLVTNGRAVAFCGSATMMLVAERLSPCWVVRVGPIVARIRSTANIPK